jgi:hypothetical protein
MNLLSQYSQASQERALAVLRYVFASHRKVELRGEPIPHAQNQTPDQFRRNEAASAYKAKFSAAGLDGTRSDDEAHALIDAVYNQNKDIFTRITDSQSPIYLTEVCDGASRVLNKG